MVVLFLAQNIEIIKFFLQKLLHLKIKQLQFLEYLYISRSLVQLVEVKKVRCSTTLSHKCHHSSVYNDVFMTSL